MQDTVPISFEGMAVPTKVVGMKYVFYNITTVLTFCILSSKCTKDQQKIKF